MNRYLSSRLFPNMPMLERIYGLILRLRLTISEAAVTLEHLPQEFDNLSILLVTDLHVGPLLSSASLHRAMQRLSDLSPDILVIAGDLITSSSSEVQEAVDALRPISASLGVFAVPGNHEHYTGDLEQIINKLENLGIKVLNNSSVTIRKGGDELVLAGIDDLNLGEPDLESALIGAAPNSTVVLVSHNPDILFDAACRNVDLVLSGHTHGGQVRIPRLPVLVRMSRFHLDYGRYICGNTELVVSRGIGVVGAPVRIACSPEVVLVSLQTAVRRN